MTLNICASHKCVHQSYRLFYPFACILPVTQFYGEYRPNSPWVIHPNEHYVQPVSTMRFLC